MTRFNPPGPYRPEDRVIDELLVLHVLSGDQRALDRLALRWQPRLLRVAYHITGNRELAETAAQDAWIGICRSWLSLRDTSKFSPWAFGILRRKCQDAIRNKARGAARAADMADRAEAPNYFAVGETRAAIRQAFGALSPDHREAALLYFVEELTLAEIAALSTVPVGTIKSRIFHARRQLKAHLEGETND